MWNIGVVIKVIYKDNDGHLFDQVAITTHLIINTFFSLIILNLLSFASIWGIIIYTQKQIVQFDCKHAG